MSLYKVRFIREAIDPEGSHLVVEVEASNHTEALERAMTSLKDSEWLSAYGFWSVEINRY